MVIYAIKNANGWRTTETTLRKYTQITSTCENNASIQSSDIIVYIPTNFMNSYQHSVILSMRVLFAEPQQGGCIGPLIQAAALNPGMQILQQLEVLGLNDLAQAAINTYPQGQPLLAINHH